MYPGQTDIVNVLDNTSRFGTLMAFYNPIQENNGSGSMGIRIRIDTSRPLQFGYYTPNNRYEVNRVDMTYLELSRIFCNFCNRLGYENEDYLGYFLLNHPSMQMPVQPDDLPEHNPFPEDPFAHAAYHQEALYNIDKDDPDSDWSLENLYSPINTIREQSAVSYTDGEGPGEGYLQVGFHSDMSSDSERTISEWEVVGDDSVEEIASQQLNPLELPSAPATAAASPVPFITSDIEYDMLSDLDSASTTSSPTSTLNWVSLKRQNPEQQYFLMSIDQGTSTATSNLRGVSQEDYN